ncbi:MAG: hypothetical protein KAR39_00745 [Thermoplasmata archaeon]|nr:hypothetical protein [Thermoplasmata archaeon]
MKILESGETSEEMEPGEETEWLEFTEINVPSGKLIIFDPLVSEGIHDGLIIEVPAGTFQLWVKDMMTESGSIFSRLRIVLPGKEPSLGKVLGTTCTDVAMTGVCDDGALAPYRGNYSEWEKIQDEIFDVSQYGIVTLDQTSRTTLPVISSGSSDGTFPVRELTSDSTRVGAEVEFAAPDKSPPEGYTSDELIDQLKEMGVDSRRIREV